MSNVIAPFNAKETQITAVITRADGSVEYLGVVSYWHRNPLKRLFWRMKKWLHFS
jgi:hypothetical protein